MPLTEVKDAAPDDTAADRRWYRGDDVELVVWEDDQGVRQYQLRYEHAGQDGVLEWRRTGHLYHYRLDDGESRAARVDAAPVLHPDGPGDLAWVRARFEAESEGLETALRTLVMRTLAGPG